MIHAVHDYEFPCLFFHTTRTEWGVAVLVGEDDGKRRYLFDNGTERTLVRGFYQLMQRVERPTEEQSRVYAKLCGILTARNPNASKRPTTFSVLDQLAAFHAAFSSGFKDPLWLTAVRGEGAAKRLPHHRQPMLQEAKEQLSEEALESLLKNQHFGRVWEQAANLVGQSGLVSATKLKAKPAPNEQRSLAIAIRDLLYGTATYNLRFNHFVHTYTAAFGQFPQWELATALSALVHPTEHVCVDAALFRKQMKVTGSRKTIGAQPSSSGYGVLLGSTRQLAKTLAEQGEEPRDLFDVRDFVTITLKPPKPAPKTDVAAAKPAPPARAAAKPAKAGKPGKPAVAARASSLEA